MFWMLNRFHCLHDINMSRMWCLLIMTIFLLLKFAHLLALTRLVFLTIKTLILHYLLNVSIWWERSTEDRPSLLHILLRISISIKNILVELINNSFKYIISSGNCPQLIICFNCKTSFLQNGSIFFHS